ncbi:MAG: hypothetical protein R3F34_12835 [Planctomycetota bacterium]
MKAFPTTGLDATSRSLARELLHGNAELATWARREVAPGGGQYFVLEVPPPSGEHAALVVDAGDRGRVAVRLGRFSIEFDAPPHGGRTSELPEAVSLVEDLLAGEVRVWVGTRDGAFVGQGLVRKESDLRAALARCPRGTEVEVTRWDEPPALFVC